MASSSQIEAGRAFVRLFLKDDMTRNLRRSLRQTGESMKNVGASAMRMGAAIVGPIALAVRQFAKFDAQMGNVATMLDRPAEFLPGFTEGIKSLAVEFGKTKDELATGLYDILSATVPPEQAMQRLAAATKLASAGNAEVGASVSVLNTLMDTYGDSFRDAGDASDFLFAIVKRGRTNLAELSGSLGDIIAAAKAAGMSVEDMGASVALLTRATGNTDSALTALQAISATFLKPGTEGAKLWEEEFGDAMDTTTLKTLGMAGVLERLSKLDPAKVAKIFPNMRAIRGIFPAIAKMEGFSDDLQGMADRAGNVDEAFAKGAGPMREWQQGLEQIKNIMGAIGQSVVEAILPHIDTIKAMGESVQRWVESNKNLVATVAAIGAALITAGAVFYTFGTILGGVATAIKTVQVAITFLVAHPVVAVFAAIAAGLIVLQRATSYTADLSRAMAEAREEGDKQRQSDQARMDQLKQLAAQESRNAQEMETAKKLIAELEERYGKLGIAIDETTGAITGMTAAQSKLNAEQAKQAKQELKREILERQRNVNELAREMQSPGWLREAGEFLGAVGEDSRLNEVQARIDAERRAIAQLTERYKQIAEGDMAGALGATPTTGEAAPAPDLGSSAATEDEETDPAAEQRRRDAEQRLQDEIDRLQIEATKKGREKELALLDLEEKQALREAKESGADAALVRRQFALKRQMLGPEQSTQSQVPRGAALTATYSAAAARIAGYQAGGPEQKMADGIQHIMQNTMEMARDLEEFLAGWRVA